MVVVNRFSYVKATINMNDAAEIDRNHVDKTQPFEIGNWQPNYDKLVLAHKNVDGTVSFDAIKLPQIPNYKAVINNPTSTLFTVSFIALPKTTMPASNDVKPVTIEVTKPIVAKTEHKAITPIAIKTIDLLNDVVPTPSDVSTWHVANELERDTYRVSNGKYTVELPHISNAQLHVIANDSTKDSVFFTYKGQNVKYIFNIKFVNGHYLLTTYEIKSGKLVKLIDCNFVESSKMIETILEWLQLK